MRKVYLDTIQGELCISVFVNDAEVIFAGAAVNAMSVKHKNSEYQRFADEYDIHFIFEDEVPKIDFYTIPMVDIFATDSAGGFIGSIGKMTDLQGDVPICYIDANRACYRIAENGEEFLSKVSHWKEELTPYADIEFWESLEAAREKYEFLDRGKIEQELRGVNI